MAAKPKVTLTYTCERCGKEQTSHPDYEEVNAFKSVPAGWCRISLPQHVLLCGDCRQALSEWMGK